MRYVSVAPDQLQLRIPVALPLAMLSAGIDVLHAQYLAPPVSPGRVVVSIHDIAFEHYPQFFPRTAIPQMRILVPLTARRACAVLTLSEFCKQDIVRRYCLEPDKVVVAGGAANPMFKPVHDGTRLRAIRTQYGIGNQFLLCVGNLQPRKNLKTLIAAYMKLRQADIVRHKLVVVGRKAWLYDDAFVAARNSGYSSELIFTGYVPDDDLVALYNAADAFVYPSIFEGFGLPPLEAMACGTPAITSNTSCFPEVVGDAAVMIDPLDTDALAQAITTVLLDANLRAHLRQAGMQRAKRYSWESTARIILSTYCNAMQRTSSSQVA
jgi:glycosyltransferase involved in cell wall biosynthesis